MINLRILLFLLLLAFAVASWVATCAAWKFDEVAEGVRTTYAACELGTRHGVEMPIAQTVRRLLDGEIRAEEIVSQIMQRQLRSENE